MAQGILAGCITVTAMMPETPEAELFETGNSYFGLLRQSPQSHHDRARLAKVLLGRGRCVDRSFTKAYLHG